MRLSEAAVSANRTFVTGTIWVAICVLGAIPGVAWAQINVVEPNLHDDAEVYGLLAPTTTDPFVNPQSISLLATGSSDSSLYSKVSFTAYGLFGDVNLVNEGILDVNAIGGDLESIIVYLGQTEVYAYGIGTGSDANLVNTGTVNVTARGGTYDTMFRATSDLYVRGLNGDGDINNVGNVTVTAIGGYIGYTPDATGIALAGGIAGNHVDNEGDITVSLSAPSGIGFMSGTSSVGVSSSAYGVSGSDVSNTGSITVSTNGGGGFADIVSSSTSAGGIYGTNIVNTGNVMVTANGGGGGSLSASAGASAYGITGGSDGSVNNSGDFMITVEGGTASPGGFGVLQAGTGYGYAYGIKTNSGTSVNNSGNLAIVATGGRADRERVYGYGIAASSADVSNSGDITVNVIGSPRKSGYKLWDMKTIVYGYGIEAESSEVNSSGDIVVTIDGGSIIREAQTSELYAWASGISSTGGDVNITGSIAVTVQGGATDEISGASDVSAIGTGINVSSSNVDSLGNISVTVYGGDATSTGSEEGIVTANANAYGIWADGSGKDVFNSGAITMLAEGGVANSSSADATAATVACGVYSSLTDVNNLGRIDVTASGGDAHTSVGIADATVDACGIWARDASVNNSADITVNATSENGFNANAYGIYLESGGSVTNTGIIRTSGPAAYEVYVASGTARLVDTYNVTLDGSPSDEPFGVASGATLDLNGATLTVTDVAGGTIWDREYQLFEAVGSGAVDGSFSDVEAVNPDALARYHMQGTANAADDTVSLSYKPEASETKGSAAVEKQLVTQSMGIVHHRMTSTLLNSIVYPGSQGLLVDAGPLDKSLDLANSASRQSYSGAFIEPYYSRMDQEADPLGHDARLWGFAAGYERQMDSTVASIHAGYGRANIDYTGEGYNANGEEQDILTGGLAAVTRWGDWTVRYGVTGFYGWHDYHGLTGAGLTETETASIDSYGVVATGMLGHVFRCGSHVLLPEVGVNYLWGHRRRYTTDASDPAWDTTYSTMDDHDVEAEAALHWMTGFMHKGIHVMPAASVGIRHLLTDDESIVRQSIPGIAPVSVKSERDRTAVTASGSVALTKSNHTLSVAYDGEYSNDTTRHSFWFRYGWWF